MITKSTKCYIGRSGPILLFVARDMEVNHFAGELVAVPLTKLFIFKVGFVLELCW